jgi:CheY-like chemotaxis protein
MDENLLLNKTILVVDDENDLRDIVASEFDFMGAKVFQAENITVAQKLFQENKIDLIVSDIRMPGGTGIDLLDNLKRKDFENPPVILITGFADITVEDAFDKGAEALMNKPFKLDDLIQQAVRFTSPKENRFLEKQESVGDIQFETVDSISEAMKKHKFLLGRGGVSALFDLKGKRVDVGLSYSFTFKFSDVKLEGTVVCRWNKYLDQQVNHTALGLEFQSLSSESLKSLGALWQGEIVRPFIPAFNTKEN